MNPIQHINFAKYRLTPQVNGIATDPDGLTLIDCYTADQATAIDREQKHLPPGRYFLTVQGMRYASVAV